MYKVIISLLAIFCGYVSVSAQRLYLSGTGSDDTRTWDFYCSAGQHSGKWRKIQVPSCWELQGSGDVSFTLDGKEIPYDKSAGCYHCGNVSTWDPEHPNLHTATFTLKSSGHSITRKIGFRTIEFRPHEGKKRQERTMVKFPDGDISFLLSIPPMQSYKPLEQLGPGATPHNIRIKSGDEGFRIRLVIE